MLLLKKQDVISTEAAQPTVREVLAECFRNVLSDIFEAWSQWEVISVTENPHGTTDGQKNCYADRMW